MFSITFISPIQVGLLVELEEWALEDPLEQVEQQ